MRILHVLTQFALTGAEVYAATLANAQIAEGNEVFIVSPFWHSKVSAKVVKLPLGYGAISKRVKSVFMLRNLIKRLRIDVVHAHSRASSWVCYFATKGTQVPFISTVHGRQHLHKYKRNSDVYGARVIAVCENIRLHLMSEMGMKPSKISVIPNGMDFPELLKGGTSILPPFDGVTLCIPGRTSGPKGERTGLIISKILPAFFKKHPNFRIVIVGGDLTEMDGTFQQSWVALSQKYPQQCIWVGFVNNLKDYISDSQIIIGSGRVAIEAIAASKVTLSFGESCYTGIVNEHTLKEAIDSNFGDISSAMPLPIVDWGRVASDFETAIHEQLNPVVRNNILETYNLPSVLSQVNKVYKEVLTR
jgi:glycosyltransferase involved in cell wall biosynthesis